MPLSEHEQRQLEQIEQALYADYPKLAQAVRARDPRVHYKRRMLAAAAGLAVGIGLLVAGLLVRRYFPWIAVGGFVIMLGCAVWSLNSWRHIGGVRARSRRSRLGRSSRGPAVRRSGPGASRRGRTVGPTFMERMEERWRRRQEGDG